MASPPMMFHDLGPRVKQQTVKAHLLASQQLLVTSLYNVAPLLDCLLSTCLLSQDNYQDIKAEKTPHGKARKLLEIVQAQMDEEEASRFMGCLRECKQHYPRLQKWLLVDTDIQRGPTERQLQAQFYSLCNRLGSSVLPVSLALFSSSTLTQFDLERIQAALTPTQQTQTLLSICLTKGETACKSFYTALYNEDQQLAEDMNITNLLEHIPDLSINSDCEGSSVAVAVEETRSIIGNLPYSGVLRQVRAQLGIALGEEARLNICELGVAVGLPRSTIRECLLEGVSIEDAAQLEALVSLFLEKTQDENRLLGRVAELGIQWFQLSDRGCLSLKLLQEAEALLRSGSHSHLHAWDHLHDEDHLRSLEHQHSGDCRDQCTMWAIFSFLVWDCLALAVEDPEPKPSNGLAGMLQQLQNCEQVEAALLQELEQCWQEGGAENLLQSVRVLAQILRDLHPFEDHIRLSAPVEGVHALKHCKFHRVTSFKGVSARMIRKALGSIAPTMTQDATPQARQYREVCIQVARLLDTVQQDRGNTDLTNATVAQVTQHICLTLSKPTFRSEAFNVGVRHRLQSLVEFNPAQLGLSNMMQLHQDTLSQLQCYLQPSEHHNFRFIPESVRVLRQPQTLVLSVASVRGPVAIDNGMEEDFRFVTSELASFLVRIRCFGFEEGKGRFDVSKPRCWMASQLREESVCATRFLGGEILAEEDDKMWIREGGSGWKEELQSVAVQHSIQLRDEGCCFKVMTTEAECEVRFIYKAGRLWAAAQRNCEVI